MKTIAIANAKGGVGKTSLAVNLAAGLADGERRVLLVDMDPQGNATAWLMGLGAVGTRGTADVLREGKLTREHVTPVETCAGLELLASTPALAGLESMLAEEIAGETVLRRALARAEGWDFVVIDCPPAIGLGVLNALCASDGVVAPVLGAYLSLAGLRKLEQTVDQIRDRLGSPTKVLGYVLFAADPREAITAEARGILRKEAKEKLFKAEVRVSTAAKSLPARRETVWTYRADERGARDYHAVLMELLRRLGATAKRRAA